MTTDPPLDTDQPLFPGNDGIVDDLIQKVNIMEGYGGKNGALVVSPNK